MQSHSQLGKTLSGDFDGRLSLSLYTNGRKIIIHIWLENTSENYRLRSHFVLLKTLESRKVLGCEKTKMLEVMLGEGYFSSVLSTALIQEDSICIYMRK